MKKLSILLVAVLLIASLFVSCDNSTKAVKDELVEVSFSNGSGSRDLSYSIEPDPTLQWFYAAEKAVSPEFNVGATDINGLPITLGTPITFSQGKWNFKLWAERGAIIDEEGTVTHGTKVYYGELKGVILDKKSQEGAVEILIPVSSNIEGVQGKIKFNTIPVKNSSGDVLVQSVTKVKIDGNEQTIKASKNTFSVNPGMHSVVVYYSYASIEYASEQIDVYVGSGKTTTISGFLREETLSVIIKGEEEDLISDTNAVVKKQVNTSEAIEVNTSITPYANATYGTTISIPEGAISEDGEGEEKEITLDVKVDHISSSSFCITEQENAIASISVELLVGDNSFSQFNNPVEIVTYIESGLSEVNVMYVGEESLSQPTDIIYDSSTGKLSFKTTHFSDFVVSSPSVIAVNLTQKKVLTSLANAMNNLTGGIAEGDTVLLLKDVELPDYLRISDVANKIKFDLNGHTISASPKAKYATIMISNSTVEFTGTGTIVNKTNGGLAAISVQGTRIDNDDLSKTKTVTIGSDITLKGNSGIYIGKLFDTSTGCYLTQVNMNGKIIVPALEGQSAGSGIYVNGNVTNTSHAPIINLVGAQIDAKGVGIYAAGNAVWNISGDTKITGINSAIEIRAGKLTINGGTYTATADSQSVTANSSGTTTVGAAIAVAQHTTKLPINVTISGGTFEGYSAVYESDPQGNKLDNVSLSISGGTFKSTNNGTKEESPKMAVYSEDVTGFITGGTFNSNPTEYIAEDYRVKTEDGNFVVESAVVEVSTKEQLSDALNATYNKKTIIRLLNDIELTSDEWGVHELSLGPDVAVTIDGNHKTISGLTTNTVINANGFLSNGLITSVTSTHHTSATLGTLTVKNLTVDRANLNSEGTSLPASSGVIVGDVSYAHFVAENCNINNAIVTSTQYAAGIVGYCQQYNYGETVTLKNCTVTGSTFNGNDATGALVALSNISVTIEGATITGNTINGDNGYSASALVGTSIAGTIATNVNASGNTFSITNSTGYQVNNSTYGYIYKNRQTYSVNGTELS